MTDATDPHIAALQAELAALRTEMQNFTYAVSHDLRAPLRHVVSFAQLVRDEAGPQLDPEVLGFLATISDSARQMGAMLDALSALARVGTVPLQLQAVPLPPLLQELCAAVGAAYPQRALEWRLAADLPTLLADENLLRQALQQVLDNAVKFSAPRALAVIDITAHRAADGRVALAVRDNGVGFAPAQQARLFQVFGRLHSPQQFAGLGLGLALARKAVQRMGGALDAEAAPEAGCCLTLRLAST
ncbi:MAG: sensor histidine kinase [Rhodoferax sp.]